MIGKGGQFGGGGVEKLRETKAVAAHFYCHLSELEG